MRPKPQITFGANASWISSSSPSSTTVEMTSRMSYGVVSGSGISPSRSRSRAVWAVADELGIARRPHRTVLRKVPEQRPHVVERILLVPGDVVRVAGPSWHGSSAPPSSSNPTSSPVTALITSGPVMNMWATRSTITVKSVRAGE